MSTPKPLLNLPYQEAIAHYLKQGYDLEAARRLAEFDEEYTKLLTQSEIEEYLALRTRTK